MSGREAGTPSTISAERPPYALPAEDVVAAAGSDTIIGLSATEAAGRLSTHGPNEIAAEKPPSPWRVAAQLLRDPMNLMLVAVVVVSLLIGEVSTGVVVGLLIILNLVLGTRQELTARASVDALAKMQVPQARVVRDGAVMVTAATQVVPGDLVQVEAGDIVPADGRIVRSATLEAQEAALTGESAPIAKDAGRTGVRRRGPRRPHEHALPEHLGDPRHGHHRRHGDRDADADGPDRDDAHLGDAHPLAAAARARLAHQGSRRSSPGGRSPSSSWPG